MAQNKSVVILNLEKNSLNQVPTTRNKLVSEEHAFFDTRKFTRALIIRFGLLGRRIGNRARACAQHYLGKHQSNEPDAFTMGRQMPR